MAAVLAVTAPLLFTKSGFAPDFTNALWLVSVAGRGLVEAGHPNFFINAPAEYEMGVFYPWFAFYAGPLYMIAGGIAELIGGHPEIAFAGITVLAVVGAYGGTLWLGREFGLRGWIAHAPALAVITSAYYITDMYGRGAWPELLGTSAIAPLVASGVHLVRAPAWRPLPVLVFAASAVIFTGSHNITALWGTAVGAGALLVMWVTLGARRRLPYRRLAMVAGLGLASAMVNAWFLLPDVAYAGNTYIGSTPPFSGSHAGLTIWSVTGFFETPAVLLDPLRTVPSQSTTPALYVQVPDWFLVWGLAAGALLLWRAPRARVLRRAWIGVVVVIALLLGMMMIKPFWDVVSYPFDEIQFPYRLGSYLFYAVAGLVIVGALALQRATVSEGSRRVVKGLRLALVAACAVSFGLCLWQLWVPNTLFPGGSYTNRAETLVGVHNVPRTWYDPGSYHDRREPLVEFRPERVLSVLPSQVHGDRFAAWVNVPPGSEPIKTNIGGGDYLVHIGGLRWLGRSPAGFAVVERVNGGSGPVYVTIETAHNSVIELGRLLSIVGAIAVLAILLCTGVRARRARTRSSLRRDRRQHGGAALQQQR